MLSPFLLSTFSVHNKLLGELRPYRGLSSPVIFPILSYLRLIFRGPESGIFS